MTPATITTTIIAKCLRDKLLAQITGFATWDKEQTKAVWFVEFDGGVLMSQVDQLDELTS